MEDCARILGIDASVFENIENGIQAPSLPQLEMIAYYLDIPPEHFFGNQALTSLPSPIEDLELNELYEKRQRTIGKTLRNARQSAGFTPEAVENATGITARDLNQYESGRNEIPLPVLEMLSDVLGTPLKEFQDQSGPVGVWTREQRTLRDFLLLSPDMQEFVCRPVNRPYLELARRLSEMSVEKLRAVAEGLLEITL